MGVRCLFRLLERLRNRVNEDPLLGRDPEGANGGLVAGIDLLQRDGIVRHPLSLWEERAAVRERSTMYLDGVNPDVYVPRRLAALAAKKSNAHSIVWRDKAFTRCSRWVHLRHGRTWVFECKLCRARCTTRSYVWPGNRHPASRHVPRASRRLYRGDRCRDEYATATKWISVLFAEFACAVTTCDLGPR
jgi:hypothetical protein